MKDLKNPREEFKYWIDYGFKFGYKVGDQVFVLDFTEGFKWKDTIAVKIKY